MSQRTTARFEPGHPDALAIYCSDGRFTEAVEELLHHAGHARLDTLTIPGGPALLQHTSGSLMATETLRGATDFLVRGHAIRHVVLIAHQGCGYYRHHFPDDAGDAAERRQASDLRAAARWLASRHEGVGVTAFLARVVDRGVAFEAVDLES